MTQLRVIIHCQDFYNDQNLLMCEKGDSHQYHYMDAAIAEEDWKIIVLNRTSSPKPPDCEDISIYRFEDLNGEERDQIAAPSSLKDGLRGVTGITSE